MSEQKNIRNISEAPSYEDRLDDQARLKGARNGKIAAGVLAAVGLAAFAGNAIHDKATESSFEQKVEAQVEADPTILNAKVVLSEGVKLRSEPLMNNGDGAGEASNVLSEVKSGQVLLLDHPLVYTNQVNEEFVGALDKEGNYFWVNAGALEEQEQTSGENYITYIEDKNAPEEGPANFSGGRFYQGAEHDELAATASSMPISEIETVLSHG